MVYSPGSQSLLRYNAHHDAHGKFASGSSASAGEEDLSPGEPEQLSSATHGSLQVAKYRDSDGAEVVAITAGKSSFNDLNEANFVIPEGDKAAVADGLDAMARSTTGVHPTAADPTYGPVLLAQGSRGSLHYGAYHDIDGDLVGEGQSFIALTERGAPNMRDVLNFSDRVSLDPAEARWLSAAVRAA